MSATLVMTAVFELCPSCQRHGRIRTADGRTWPQVGSREKANQWLDFILSQQRFNDPHFITTGEEKWLRRQIRHSDLPKQQKEVPAEVQKAIQELNCRDGDGQCLLPAHLTADLP